MSDIDDEHMSAHGNALDQHDSCLSDEHRDNPPHLSPSSRTSSQGMQPPLGTNTDLASIIGHGSEQDMAPTEIRERTEACMALFENLKNQPEFRIHHGRWVDQTLFQFLWRSLETDATKCGHSSLDRRVQNRIDLRIDLRINLKNLEISLKKCIKIAKEMQEASTTQREREPELEGRAPANTTTTDSSDRDAEIETTTQLERAPELEGRDTANTTTTHSSNRDAEIKLQKYWVEIALQFLARISESIKSSGIKFSHERVDKLLKQREAELEEFRTHLLYLIPLGPDDMDPTRFVDSKRLTVVQARLIHANLVRRNRFQVYFSRYSRLMGEKKSEDGKAEKQNPVAEPSKISQPAAVSRS